MIVYAVVELPDGTKVKILRADMKKEDFNEDEFRNNFYDWFIENTTLDCFEDENGNILN